MYSGQKLADLEFRHSLLNYLICRKKEAILTNHLQTPFNIKKLYEKKVNVEDT